MMVAIVALGALGAAYTLWYEDLELHADLTTGTFNADWSCEDDDPDNSPQDCTNGAMPIASLDLGQTYLPAAGLALATGQSLDRIADKLPECSASIGTNNAAGQANDVADNNVLNLRLSELYPYAGCEFWIDVHNAGTVPMHISLTGQEWEGDQAGGGNGGTGGQVLDAMTVRVVGGNNLTLCNALLEPLRHPVNTPQEISGLQLHAGEELICHFTWTLGQVNVEGFHDIIWLTFRAHQWNENLPPAAASGGGDSFGN